MASYVAFWLSEWCQDTEQLSTPCTLLLCMMFLPASFKCKSDAKVKISVRVEFHRCVLCCSLHLLHNILCQMRQSGRYELSKRSEKFCFFTWYLYIISARSRHRWEKWSGSFSYTTLRSFQWMEEVARWFYVHSRKTLFRLTKTVKEREGRFIAGRTSILSMGNVKR